ncbi:putative signal transducing protein [Vibrio maerlii]|uniref:putative signal transducing protein n=1 Tax=Vibrio maerlii TaxID=2231648 RepID=UPI000E3DF5F4|nr:DUF2007 domain-containing protein [Vibrio maerlii]
MKVFTASNPTEAHIVCGLLTSNDIQAEVRGEQLFAIQGEVPFDDSTSPSVWLVEPSSAMEEKATSIVQDYLDSINQESSWFCQSCEEENEAQFGLCWNCGQAAGT